MNPTLIGAICQRQNIFWVGNMLVGVLRFTREDRPHGAAIRRGSANESELSGWYRSDLRCASGWVGRSSANARPHRIRMRSAQRVPNPPGCRKHNHLGKPHARRTLCRQTEHRSRALLGSASLVSFDRKRSRRNAELGYRASSPRSPFESAYAILAAAILWIVEFETLAVPIVGVPTTTVAKDFITSA